MKDKQKKCRSKELFLHIVAVIIVFIIGLCVGLYFPSIKNIISNLVNKKTEILIGLFTGLISSIVVTISFFIIEKMKGTNNFIWEIKILSIQLRSCIDEYLDQSKSDWIENLLVKGSVRHYIDKRNYALYLKIKNKKIYLEIEKIINCISNATINYNNIKIKEKTIVSLNKNHIQNEKKIDELKSEIDKSKNELKLIKTNIMKYVDNISKEEGLLKMKSYERFHFLVNYLLENKDRDILKVEMDDEVVKNIDIGGSRYLRRLNKSKKINDTKYRIVIVQDKSSRKWLSIEDKV